MSNYVFDSSRSKLAINEALANKSFYIEFRNARVDFALII